MDKTFAGRAGESFSFRVIVFHLTPAEAALVERALRRFGGPRRRRGAALASAVRAAVRQCHADGDNKGS